MHPYKLVMFDLDGTLTDPGSGIIRSIMYALRALNCEVPQPADLKTFIGPPLQESFKTHFKFNEQRTSEAIHYYREYFTQKGMYENEIYPGMIDMLEALQREKIILTVATSKPTLFAEKILSYFKMDSFFDTVVGSHLDGTRTAKSEIIAEVLKHYPNIPKHEIVMIGDRVHDIIGAKQNKITSIGVLYGYGSKEEICSSEPDVIAQSVNELYKALIHQGKSQLNQTFV